jgi:hypothetical protein
MTNTNFRGPVNSLGAMEDATSGPDDGPNYQYQGTVFPALREGTFPKDGVGAGRSGSFLDNPQFVLVDNIPQAATTTLIAAANSSSVASIVNGTPLALSTTAAGNATAGTPSVATGVPLIPFGSATPVTAAIAIDFGFTTGTTTAASSSVVVVNTAVFTVGQWLVIGGAGNAGKTACLITQVAGITNATTITISPSALGTLTNAPIGSGNLFNSITPPSTQFGPSQSTANAVTPTWLAGMFRSWDPLQALSRNISITTVNTTGAGGGFIVNGWDAHGQAMSELITVAAATTTSYYGKKAFKYIKSVIPQFTDATGAYSVGVGDTFGMPMRMDRYEYLNWCYNGINAVNSSGFIAAVLSVATNTTGDVRGTLQVSTVGTVQTGTSVITNPAASNNTSRLWMSQTIPLFNDIAGTPTNTAPFYGVTQA